MKIIKSTGGPLMGLDRASLPQWGGVFHSSFFGTESVFENDYNEMCNYLDQKRSTNLSVIRGFKSEALLIDLPLPTFLVEADGISIHLVQIWSSEQGWSESSITLDDFGNDADWQGPVRFFCGGGEFLIFDSSCPSEDIEEHFSLILERGVYKVETCEQNRIDQALIVLIRAIKQD